MGSVHLLGHQPPLPALHLLHVLHLHSTAREDDSAEGGWRQGKQLVNQGRDSGYDVIKLMRIDYFSADKRHTTQPGGAGNLLRKGES